MARTDRFRMQHNELLAADGAAARSCLARLMGKLTMHLSTEDKVLYPELAASKDAAVATLAKRFSTEMRSTAAVVTTYNNKWHTPTAIKADPKSFITESKQIIAALADRIKRENNELYAAADRSEGAAF